MASAVYLSLLGKTGLRQVAELCYHKAHYAAEQIGTDPRLRHCASPSRSSTSSPCAARARSPRSTPHLLEHGILGGYDLGQDYPALKNHMLIAVTEMNTKEEIDTLVEVLLAEVSHD